MNKILILLILSTSLSANTKNQTEFFTLVDSLDMSREMLKSEIKKGECYIYSLGFYRYYKENINPFSDFLDEYYEIKTVIVLDIRHGFIQYCFKENRNIIKSTTIEIFKRNVRKLIK